MIKHIGFIMDGNRRYAKKNSISIEEGYNAGMKKLLELIEVQIKYKIKETSFFALSKENYEKRPETEKKTLFKLIQIFQESSNIKKLFQENKIKLNLIGDIKTLKLKEKKINSIINKFNSWNLKNNSHKFIVNILINYNGQEEILNSFKNILNKIKNKELEIEKITTETIKKNLWLTNKEPEIIVRTGKCQRLSGFMLWDSQYSEIYFLNKFWPEFIEKDFIEILNWYSNIKRNFGT